MTRTIQVAPSLLAADFMRLADEVHAVEAAGADIVHFDVMDGHFVPNLSMGLPVLSAVRKATSLPLDVHLMITNADAMIERYAEAGADWISVHVEASPHLHRTLQRIRAAGKRAGAVLNPATGPEAVEYVLDHVDHVLVMSVNPGFGGQRFLPAVLPKIAFLREAAERRGLSLDIEVDGGITPQTAQQVIDAGASVLVAGSAVFRQGDYGAAIAALRGS